MTDQRKGTRILRATLASQVEQALRNDIVSGHLPPEQHLRAADLVDRYGVSPTPLREALQRLAAQNLVRIDPRLGAFVAGVSPTELRDIYFMRDVLETIALECSIERGGAEWEREVTEAWETFSRFDRPRHSSGSDYATSWAVAHRAFHNALFAACGSPWLLRFIETLADHSERYRVMSVMTGHRNTLEEHGNIRQAALDRNRDAAVSALRDHLRATVELIERQSAPEPHPDPAATE